MPKFPDATYLILLVPLAVMTFLYGQERSRAGELKAEVRIAERQIKALEQAAQVTKTQFVHDTVTLTKKVTVYERLAAQVDTQYLRDTVPVPVEVVRTVVANADSTIQACRDVVSSCSLALAARDSLLRSKSDLIRTLEKSRPSFFRRWAERIAAGSVGYTLAKLTP